MQATLTRRVKCVVFCSFEGMGGCYILSNLDAADGSKAFLNCEKETTVSASHKWAKLDEIKTYIAVNGKLPGFQSTRQRSPSRHNRIVT
jgi:hypothetical protein